nr:unnamed protein product [Callosobruchus analis]
MGNTVVSYATSGFNLLLHPEVTPSPLEEPTFDPLLALRGAEKKEVMIATEEEMRSAMIPLEDRDYCAHHLLKYRGCRKEYWPWVYKCHHEKHAYLNCKYDDFVIRMKEYERERRLRVREQERKEC